MTGTPQATNGVFSRDALFRIVADLLVDELATSRGRCPALFGRLDWDAATRVHGGGLDLDSLELLGASAALSEYFHLHEYGAEDYLLQLATLGDWCDLVAQSLEATGTHLTFRTSGSTGEPKRCTHRTSDLMVEVDAWAGLLEPVAGIVSLVPAHHIYGTIFTALLPDRLGVDCRVARLGGADAVARAAPGTLVVGTPDIWAYVARALPAFPPRIVGVSSTAPLPAHLVRELQGRGLARLVEIYGSSETGGVGHRSDPAGPYTLLDHWRHDGGSSLTRASWDAAIAHDLMDRAEWIDERRFTLHGRRDGAVQVGGHNVFPERVRRRLLGHPGVTDAAVRLDLESKRLKAYVVPTSDAGGALAGDLGAWCAEALTDAERPRRIVVGAALPRNAMGKPTDW